MFAFSSQPGRALPLRRAVQAGLVALLLAPGLAQAGLGRGIEAVRADRAHFAAAMSSASRGGFSVHALTMANGGEVREYANSDGVVFAVSWRGPGRPDLKQLLGDQFSTLESAEGGLRIAHGRRLLNLQTPGLVVRSVGHPGAFHGAAYLPASVPADFTAKDLQ